MNAPDMRMDRCRPFADSTTPRFPQPVSPMETQTTHPIAALEAQITELAGHLNAGNHRFLVLIAEFDRRNGWSDSATQSCAHWLNWRRYNLLLRLDWPPPHAKLSNMARTLLPSLRPTVITYCIPQRQERINA